MRGPSVCKFLQFALKRIEEAKAAATRSHRAPSTLEAPPARHAQPQRHEPSTDSRTTPHQGPGRHPPADQAPHPERSGAAAGEKILVTAEPRGR